MIVLIRSWGYWCKIFAPILGAGRRPEPSKAKPPSGLAAGPSAAWRRPNTKLLIPSLRGSLRQSCGNGFYSTSRIQAQQRSTSFVGPLSWPPLCLCFVAAQQRQRPNQNTTNKTDAPFFAHPPPARLRFASTIFQHSRSKHFSSKTLREKDASNHRRPFP